MTTTTNPTKEQNLYLSYDPYEDEDSTYYDFFREDLQSLFDKLAYKTSNWVCQASNINWRGQGGLAFFSIFDVEDDLLRKIIPNGEWSANIYVEGRTITFVVYHHDCPTGSRYVFKPTNKVNID